MPATVTQLLNKVPEVTAIFWIIKVLSTTVGETGADYLAVHVGLGATTTAAIMVSVSLLSRWPCSSAHEATFPGYIG